MFLLNSQIPRFSISSSMLEPILLPKLHILLADFPYNRSLLRALVTHHGHLMRSRYGRHTAFSSGLPHSITTASLLNTPHSSHTLLHTYSSVFLYRSYFHPSSPSLLSVHLHQTLNQSPSQPPFHSTTHVETLVHSHKSFPATTTKIRSQYPSTYTHAYPSQKYRYPLTNHQPDSTNASVSKLKSLPFSHHPSSVGTS